ncbi:zinc finger protein 2-like isoform X2 [Zootermopsis nevadensis]|nr:zinc finger protein 2-like isoform X2 [Zootermopsis nevadensis]
MKLNTSYELVIMALNSEAELKATFDFTEDSSMQLEAVKGHHFTGVFVKREESPSEMKQEMLHTIEELTTEYECEVVISTETKISEKAEVGDYVMTESDSSTFKEQIKIPEDATGYKESGTFEEQSYKCRTDVDIKRSDVELLIKNHSIISNDQLKSVKVPSLSIYGPAICDLCDVTFTDMDEFDNHVAGQHLQKYKWHCIHCDDSFEHSQDLVMHKAMTHGEKPISCGQCREKKLVDENTGDEGIEEEWLEENETHVDENKIPANNSKDNSEFYCELCDKSFCDETKLKDHCLVHSPLSLVCSKCGLKCSSSYQLSVHKKSHLRNFKERQYVCEVCRKTFLKRVMYNIHRRHCSSKQYTCNLCDRTFWRQYSLQLHMKVHNQVNRQYECDCGQKFDTHSTFQAHKKTHERVTTMKCVTCEKVFTNETFYKKHRFIHDPEYWDRFKCQTCQRPFRDAHALKNHMQLHAGMKPHMCDLCGRTYNRYANMLKHRKLHKPQNLWEHNCTHCGARFEHLKDLMFHMEQAHMIGDPAGEDAEGRKSSMKWICRFCGKRISTKLSLLDHEHIHTGAKPYICEWCGREFRSRPNLLQHHLTHTGDRKHACAVCGKRFARKSFVVQHMRIHTGEKPFECDICGKRFTQAGDMRRHRGRHIEQQKEQVELFVQIQK